MATPDGLSLIEHVVTIAGGVLTIGAMIAGATTWIIKQGSNGRAALFERIAQLGSKMEAQVGKVTDAFREHEKDDQRRHEENIQRFADLNSKIIRRNGGASDYPHR